MNNAFGKFYEHKRTTAQSYLRSRSSQIAQELKTLRFQITVSASRPGHFSPSLWAVRTESEIWESIIPSGLLSAFMEGYYVE